MEWNLQETLVLPKCGAETCKVSLENDLTYGALILADKYGPTRLLLVFHFADIVQILARNVEESDKQEHGDRSVQKLGDELRQ